MTAECRTCTWIATDFHEPGVKSYHDIPACPPPRSAAAARRMGMRPERGWFAKGGLFGK